jgi:hypothetical protein
VTAGVGTIRKLLLFLYTFHLDITLDRTAWTCECVLGIEKVSLRFFRVFASNFNIVKVNFTQFRRGFIVEMSVQNVIHSFGSVLWNQSVALLLFDPLKLDYRRWWSS